MSDFFEGFKTYYGYLKEMKEGISDEFVTVIGENSSMIGRSKNERLLILISCVFQVPKKRGKS